LTLYSPGQTFTLLRLLLLVVAVAQDQVVQVAQDQVAEAPVVRVVDRDRVAQAAVVHAIINTFLLKHFLWRCYLGHRGFAL